jgi:hypothetical protein
MKSWVPSPISQNNIKRIDRAWLCGTKFKVRRAGRIV